MNGLIITTTHDAGDCGECDELRATLAHAATEVCATIPMSSCVGFATAIGPTDVGQFAHIFDRDCSEFENEQGICMHGGHDHGD